MKTDVELQVGLEWTRGADVDKRKVTKEEEVHLQERIWEAL